MDTPEEIAREEFINKHWEMCGTCHYKKRGYCENEKTEFYAEEVGDTGGCEEWSMRKKWS